MRTFQGRLWLRYWLESLNFIRCWKVCMLRRSNHTQIWCRQCNSAAQKPLKKENWSVNYRNLTFSIPRSNFFLVKFAIRKKSRNFGGKFYSSSSELGICFLLLIGVAQKSVLVYWNFPTWISFSFNSSTQENSFQFNKKFKLSSFRIAY